MSRVSIDKDLLDGLANSIGGKFDEDTPLTVTEQKEIIDGITKRSSTDLTASGATVTAPAGYYGSSATKSVASGTEGTPTATKGTVSDHQISVTPSVTNSAGYISGGTKTGTAVTVSASELVSGSQTIYNSGNTVVTNYQYAYVPEGTAGTPSATKGTVSNHSVSVTPSVTNTTGWINGSTKTGTAVTVTASELASGSKSISANGTGIDVVGYSTVDVAVPSDNYYLLYWFDSFGGPVGFGSSYADIKAAAQANKDIIVTNSQYYIMSAAKFIGYFTNYTFQTKTFTEGLAFRLDDPASNHVYDVMYGYYNGSLTQELVVYTDPPASGTISITSNGTGIDVSQYQYANVSVSGGSTPDGNNYDYGTTPRTSPYVNYGQADYAVLR